MNITRPIPRNENKNSMLIDIPGLSEVEDRLREVLMEGEGLIKEMCINLLNSGGKRLRPILVLNSGLCFSSLSDDMINAAAAAELIHMASLVHDDIIDKSESRRGVPTINYLYGNHASVLTGDFIFAKAFEILSVSRLLKPMEYLVEAIQDMCHGEINQASDSFNISVTAEDYFKRIAKKTGILISASCKSGAAAAGGTDKEICIMEEYGINIGYGFQIVDDILDFTGDEKKLGKPVGMDIVNGNITLPVIILLQNHNYSSKVISILKKDVITAGDFDFILNILYKTGAIEKSYEIAKRCIIRAKSVISRIDDSAYRTNLLNIADKIISREN